MKRIGLFVFFDKQGIVDDYVLYLLTSINEELDRLVIIANGMLTADGRKKLEALTKDVFVRENRGYDTAAWKEAIVGYLGWEVLKKYDEIVFFNDTFYGPLYSFHAVFEKMQTKNVDFWGLSCHDEAPDASKKGKYGYWPRHIQSFFLVVRKRMHTSYEFKKYWEDMPIVEGYNEVIANHETIFTETFSNAGYKWAVYSDTTDEKTSRYTSWCHYAFAAYDMVSNRQYPIIKKRPLTLEKKDMLPFNNGNDMKKTLEYVKQKTNYDVDLIWDNLLRTENLYGIQNGLNLTYVLSSLESEEKRLDFNNVAVVFCIQEENSVPIFKEYLDSIPKSLAIYIITPKNQIKEWLQENIKRPIIIRKTQNNGLVAVLDEFYKELLLYKYIGIGCDFPIRPDKELSAELYAYLDYELEGLIASENYIKNVLKTFSEEKKLGLLNVAPPVFGKYFANIYPEWDKHIFQELTKIGKSLEKPFNIDQNIPPVCWTDFFWIRTNIIAQLLDNHILSKLLFNKRKTEKSEQIIGMLLPYFAQQLGYYSGTMMTSQQASSNIMNLNYIVAKTFGVLKSHKHHGWDHYNIFLNEFQN